VNVRATTLLALVYGLLFASVATRRSEVAWMAAPLLTTLLLAFWRAPRREGIHLGARRHVERDRRGGVEVTVKLRNEGASPLHLRLEDSPQPAVAIEEGATAIEALLRGGEEATLRYAFRVPRGRFVWTGVKAVAADPLGLVEERLEIAAPGEIHVHPEAARFRPLPLQPGRTLPSPGSIPARVGGSGTEFFGVREYHVGDALRWIDWRLTARHRGKLFTKEFEQEQIADVGLVLDSRTVVDESAVDESAEGESVFEHALRATASLATTFLRQGNRVSLLVLGESDARVFPGSGRVQLQRILSCLAGARTRPVASLLDPGHSFARMFPARSVVIVLTPLLLDDSPLLLRLRAHGRQVVVVSPDAVELRAAVLPADLVGRLALRAARVERRLVLRALSQLRIPVVDWHVDRPLYPLVRAALRPGRGGRP
jgi:uncharacterized protein (DUF58 family)